MNTNQSPPSILSKSCSPSASCRISSSPGATSRLKRASSKKIALFCNVGPMRHQNLTLPVLYEAPIMLEHNHLAEIVCRKLHLADEPCDLTEWQQMLTRIENATRPVTIAPCRQICLNSMTPIFRWWKPFPTQVMKQGIKSTFNGGLGKDHTGKCRQNTRRCLWDYHSRRLWGSGH